METDNRPTAAITGEVGELLTRTELVRQGWIVCTPEGHSVPFDLVALRGNTVRRIQVKSTARSENDPVTYRVPVVRRPKGKPNSPYGPDVDYFACVCVTLGVVAFVPTSSISPDTCSVAIALERGVRGSYVLEDVRLLPLDADATGDEHATLGTHDVDGAAATIAATDP